MAVFTGTYLLGSSLSFMMIYVWGRRNERVRMNFLGIIPFTAPYLPWVIKIIYVRISRTVIAKQLLLI
jgi:Derlin-2/3